MGLSRVTGEKLGKLQLLGGDLDEQALAQVAGAHAGGVKMLHQVNGAAHQVESSLGGHGFPRGVAIAGAG